jgi:hypothetical protein
VSESRCTFAAENETGNIHTMENTQHNTEHMTATQRAAWSDCQLGIYDKWYRYNHKDNGAAYNTAWMDANKVYQNDNVQFIECN